MNLPSDEQNLGTMTAFAIEERLRIFSRGSGGWCYWGKVVDGTLLPALNLDTEVPGEIGFLS